MNQKQIAKFEKALASATKIFNIDPSTINLPIESLMDNLREAASVIAYFDMKKDFRTETCRMCNQEFAYAYYLSAVKCCSIPCMSARLREMGLSWDPSAPLERRWGRFVPAIVPPVPYEIIKEQTPLHEEEKPEPVISDESKKLIARLRELA